MTDDKHYNLWEEWFRNAYRIQEFTALNTLWLAYFIAGGSAAAHNQHNILKQVFQTVYTSLPDLIGILFLVRKYSHTFLFLFCPSLPAHFFSLHLWARLLTLIITTRICFLTL